jgi:hypothetical protein
MSINGTSIDLSPLLSILATIVTALLGWVAVIVKNRQAAATNESKAIAAGLKLAAICAALLQKAWGALSPDLQAAFADGKFDNTERAALEIKLQGLLKEVTDEATLAEIGSALGLPLSGVIAKIASYLIGKWTEAHDPAIVTTSANTFPAPDPAFAGTSIAGGDTGPG